MTERFTIRPARNRADIAAAVALQLEVFCEEQGIPAPLCHAGNAEALHLLARDGEFAVGTARLRRLDGASAEFARIAVLASHRGMGLGARLVRALEAEARAQRLERVTLHPHRHLESFYARLGYRTTVRSGEIVGGHELIEMQKTLSG